MQVSIMDQTWESANVSTEVEKIFNQIEEYLNNASYYFSHMIIDGVTVYEDYQDYILEHLEQIKVIQFEVATARELADQTLLSTGQYLQRALPELPSLVDGFYHGAAQENWEGFEQLLDGLQWILRMLDYMNQSELNYRNQTDYENILIKIQQELGKLETALQDRDMILIGDLLNFEIIPLLETLSAAVQITIDNEVVPNDLN